MDGHREAFNKAFVSLGYDCVQVTMSQSPSCRECIRTVSAQDHLQHKLTLGVICCDSAFAMNSHSIQRLTVWDKTRRFKGRKQQV